MNAKKARAKKAPAAASRELPAVDESVRREWRRRIEAEYRSGAHTQHLTLWLMQLGAPPELIETGLRIVRDELAHAELSSAVYREAGGAEGPELKRESLALSRHANEPLELDVLRVAVDMFCLGETVAVRLFSRLRAGGTVPVVKRAFERILPDEVVHRDFGWTLLTWLLATPLGPTFRAQLARDLPGMLARVRRNYGGIALDKLGAAELERMAQSASDAARAWGVMPLRDYVAAVDETFERDYVPRFAAVGIELPGSHDIRP